MQKNIFLNIMASRGFIQGVSGRWMSPDSKRGEGVVVELSADCNTAVASWVGGRALYESHIDADVAKFRSEVI